MLILLGCSGAGTDALSSKDADAGDWRGELVSMDLQVDLDEDSAMARLVAAPSEGQTVLSLEGQGLQGVLARTTDGTELEVAHDKDLHITLPASDGEVEIELQWSFDRHTEEGALEGGTTLLWPYHCGEVLPCRSGPADGLTWSLEAWSVEGVVLAPDVVAEAPIYQLAWARGAYTVETLGVTRTGRTVEVAWLTSARDALVGTEHLVASVDWLEETLGPYSFGDHLMSVEAQWQGGAYGGMEHHPFWHVGTDSMSDAATHVHEAAHGWFGDGVRIACWEDFVLSEGTVTYLTARFMETVVGEEQAWAEILKSVRGGEDGTAWPEGCGEVDIIEDGLFSSVPYDKGALFYKDLENRIGRAELDRALSSFYQDRVGEAARFDDLLLHVQDQTGFDAPALGRAWMRGEGIPADSTVR